MRFPSPVLNLSLTILCLWLSASIAVAQDAVAPAADSVRTWYFSYDEATAAAQKDQRHILLVIQTEWCPWCRAMNDSCWTDRGLLAMADRVALTRIDADIDTALVNKYHVRRFPTTIVTTGTGVEVDRFIGYYGASDLGEEITRALEGVGTMWEIERRLQESRNDPELLLTAAREHIERGDFGQARQFLDRARMADPDGSGASNDDVMFIQAQLLREESNWYKAIEGFKQLVKKYPESEWREDAELYIPWLYAQAGDTTEAIKRYNTFLEDYGSSAETHWVKRQIERLEKSSEPKEPQKDPQGQ